ncbi:helix-turn-helix transcriptional regulator [Cocleimonas sp. KMM 6892]|jgi:DNA-binding Xre family transcriptional regulator|uniref:helix-turn-helix domain-containing protein n=1 Tax=unclassified Cocleimonas TaxID=2639732 RepID=UPI002DBD5F41|nr:MULTISPECIES: helix-turn-helix transcriptional regulator [unclassified Cocleimonas]MEB8433596.1 helix-turn-helix transcriptional regulator [Cocleimonas sp. KMM 6892]MEC4716407.1 helix-turn-helix transcriptional regulator [Cocleimonas sp. KMM 6895]MEC4745700.1 helix-turn-helix transcriptional regulator [Cocleimonas sp. KMM 6896]
MAQTTLIISTLKKTLKSHGKTYADVAAHLGLSEASVKRMFAQQTVSLNRLDAICQMLDMEITELMQKVNDSTARQISELSDEQEQQLVSDRELLLITIMVINNWTLEEILQAYNFTEAQCIQHLAKLDRLNIIELLPNNKIKIKISSNFKWRNNGHIQRFFRESIESEFFNSKFSKPEEKLVVLNGMLSQESNAIFQRKLERLAREFDEMAKEDVTLPLSERLGYTSVLAVRDWRFTVFDVYKR